MIRIHVLLLASLLSIWGLTSCENSDTDKVNSYNLEVNLSQNEITAVHETGRLNEYVQLKRWRQSKHGTQDIPQTVSVHAT